MIEQQPMKITLEAHGYKHSSELPWDADITDILDSFYGICVSATYHPEAILNHMQEWLDEKKTSMDVFEKMMNKINEN